MSQHDGNIAAGSGAAVRADINNALPALFTNSSGASAPGTTFECQFWADTNNNLLKMRNTADDAWITVGTLDEANLALAEKSYVDALIPRKDFHNLKIVNDGSTPNTKLVVTADWIFVCDGTNDKQLRSFSETLDASTTGANGMDTGTFAANTNYFLHAIAKEDGTDALLLSLSEASPTLPSGYTYSKVISAFRTQAASAYFYSLIQFEDELTFAAAQSVLTGGAAGSWTAITLTLVPSTLGKAVNFYGGIETDINSVIYLGFDNANALYSLWSSDPTLYNVWLPLKTAQTVYYYRASGAGTLAFSLMGYKLRI